MEREGREEDEERAGREEDEERAGREEDGERRMERGQGGTPAWSAGG